MQISNELRAYQALSKTVGQKRYSRSLRIEKAMKVASAVQGRNRVASMQQALDDLSEDSEGEESVVDREQIQVVLPSIELRLPMPQVEVISLARQALDQQSRAKVPGGRRYKPTPKGRAPPKDPRGAAPTPPSQREKLKSAMSSVGTAFSRQTSKVSE